MPIRPSERDRYPANWREIRAAMLARAGNTCECRGECGSDHDGRCFAPNRKLIVRLPGVEHRWRRAEASDYTSPHVRIVQVVLTIAHLDHTPENNDPANLRALCQRCHLRYDAAHHAKNAAATRREKRSAGQADLFGKEPTP